MLVITDQQRWDWVGGAGQDHFATPALDRLAAAGVRFDRAYSGATTCVPARNALLTGLSQHRAVTDGLSLREGQWTVAHELRRAGYETAAIGRMHFHPLHADHGFDTVRLCENIGANSGYADDEVDDFGRAVTEAGLLDPRRRELAPDGSVIEVLAGGVRTFPLDARWHTTSWVAEEALRFLADRRADRPLFLVVSFPRPHGPYDPPEPYASLVDPDDVQLPTDGDANDRLPEVWREHLRRGERFRTDVVGAPHVRRVLAAVAGLVRQIDDALGQLLDALDLDRTVVGFTSDHGDFGGHRGMYNKIPWIPFDDLLRVPLVIGGAGSAAGTRCRTAVQTQDLALTFLDLAGVAPPAADLGSATIRPLIEGRSDPLLADRSLVACAGSWYPTLVRGRHKLITGLGFEKLLFDLEEDPGERHDLGEDPAAVDVLHELARDLLTALQLPPPDLPRFDPVA